jgi:hypothetical protein
MERLRKRGENIYQGKRIEKRRRNRFEDHFSRKEGDEEFQRLYGWERSDIFFIFDHKVGKSCGVELPFQSHCVRIRDDKRSFFFGVGGGGM